MNTKINILRAILIILLILVFMAIFDFSSQNGEESGSLSREVTNMVTKDIKSIQELEENKKEEVLGEIEHIIRKIAHFSIYTLVGILMMSLMSTYNLKQIKRVGISFGVGVLYAISDEFHQSFTPDRTPLFTDVIIDSCGVLVGLGIVIIMLKIAKMLRNKYKLIKNETEYKKTTN